MVRQDLTRLYFTFFEKRINTQFRLDLGFVFTLSLLEHLRCFFDQFKLLIHAELGDVIDLAAFDFQACTHDLCKNAVQCVVEGYYVLDLELEINTLKEMIYFTCLVSLDRRV